VNENKKKTANPLTAPIIYTILAILSTALFIWGVYETTSGAASQATGCLLPAWGLIVLPFFFGIKAANSWEKFSNQKQE
jgi:hypothetical protein